MLFCFSSAFVFLLCFCLVFLGCKGHLFFACQFIEAHEYFTAFCVFARAPCVCVCSYILLTLWRHDLRIYYYSVIFLFFLCFCIMIFIEQDSDTSALLRHTAFCCVRHLHISPKDYFKDTWKFICKSQT